MIYIDPPYNTGSDLVYNDDFSLSEADYIKNSGLTDANGNRILINSDTSGRFHTNWLNMIYPRLKLAKDFLADNGVIFISIDDHEIANLRKICDEIFGRSNFLMEMERQTKTTTNDSKTGINIQHESCLIYCKNCNFVSLLHGSKDLDKYKNPDNDPNGDWISDNPSAKSGTDKNNYFPVVNPHTGTEDYPPEGRFWLFSKNTIDKHIATGKICFKKTVKNNERGFIYKRYKNELKTTQKTLDSLACANISYLNSVGTKELKNLGLVEYFNYPKSVTFIKKLVLGLKSQFRPS